MPILLFEIDFLLKNRYVSIFKLYLGSFGSQIRNLHEKLHILIWSNHIFMNFLKNRPPGGPGGVPMGPRASEDPWASRTLGSQGLGLRGPMGLKDPGPLGTHGPQGPRAHWAHGVPGPMGPMDPHTRICGIGAIRVAGNSCRHGRSAE